MMILYVCEDGSNDAQRMLDQRAATEIFQRAATETFDENRTLLSTTTKQQQAMKTGPPGYSYTHIHTRTQLRTHSRTQFNTQTHTRYIHHSIYPVLVHTRTDADLNMRAHIFKTYLTYKCLHSRAHIPAYMHVYTHMQMLITQYTHAGVPAMHVYTHTLSNKQTRARMHTKKRNTINYIKLNS